MSTYWCYTASDGRRFCWNKQPTYRCPVVPPRTSTGAFEVTPAIARAAEALGADPERLARLIGRHSHGERARVDGKLTDRCATCGGRMERLGFRAWIEEPDTSDDSGARISRSLFGEAYRIVPNSPRHFDKKKEAQEWAIEEKRCYQAATA